MGVLLSLFVSKWRRCSGLRGEPDLIVPITMGTTERGLVKATEYALLRAIQLQREYPSSQIAFANPANCFPGSEYWEGHFKRGLLTQEGVPVEVILSPRVSRNSITEAECVRTSCTEARMNPRQIHIIGEEMHSRSLEFIWCRTFPQAVISIECYPFMIAIEPDQYILAQRGPRLLALANLGRHLALRILGLRLMRGLAQPTSGKPA